MLDLVRILLGSTKSSLRNWKYLGKLSNLFDPVLLLPLRVGRQLEILVDVVVSARLLVSNQVLGSGDLRLDLLDGLRRHRHRVLRRPRRVGLVDAEIGSARPRGGPGVVRRQRVRKCRAVAPARRARDGLRKKIKTFNFRDCLRSDLLEQR